MRAKSVGYSIYMVLSIMISLTIAAIPAIFFFAFIVQNFTIFVNSIWPFNLIHGFVLSNPITSYWIPPFAIEYWWLLILFVPLGLTCYGIFLGVLLGMFKLSRRGIPFLEDGYYSSDSEAWLLYEYFEIYYVLFPYFAGFFTVFLDTKPRHQAFGCKIGKNTVVGNGRLFNPERTIIGDNCFFGYDAILSGHVYESGRLYLKTVKLGNNVTVGANAVVLPGADIGDNVIVGANTVVPKDTTIPPNTIWVHGKAIPRKPKSKAEKLHQPIGGPSELEPEDKVDIPENGERLSSRGS
ncbi:MAG: DapH/DapD/GlmU-related protein [Candidatus Thorarchaeota archaeon]